MQAFVHAAAAADPVRLIQHLRRFRHLVLQLVPQLVLMALLSFGLPLHAADIITDNDAALDQARTQMDGILAQLKRDAPEADLPKLRSQALALQDQTAKIADALEPEVAKVNARLTELGKPPAAGAEPPDVAAQRAALQKSATQLDSMVKLAKLIAVEGGQAAEQVATERRARFGAQLGERTASILATPFWSELIDNSRSDLSRVATLGRDLRTTASLRPWTTWLVVAAFTAAMLVVRIWSGRLLRRLVTARVPASRLRRSLYALLQTVLSVLAPGLAIHALRLGFTWQGSTPSAVESLLVSVVGSVCFGAFISGLGKALLSPRRPDWRLPALSDRVANGMRRYPLLLAVVMVLGWQLQKLATIVNSGLATVVAINCVFAIALGLLIARVLRRTTHLADEARAAGEVEAPRPMWLGVTLSALWIVLVLSLLSLLIGYVALGSFVVGQIAWLTIVATSTYLLSAVVDDVCMTWIASLPLADETPTEAAHVAAGEAHIPRLRDQAAVLLSGVVRVMLVLVAVVSVTAPFGQGPAELLQRSDQIGNGLSIGQIQVQPGALLQAVLVFGVCMFAVRALQRWLDTRFLPTTALDAGMRSSATTLLGFVGTVVAIAMALAAVGLGLERIAWVASALSVGIGFGLQAVVSNFVSGLILLAERPVKVGDWVSLSGVEGDIRRINVRATEIQMGDRSTVIVPNSEFITKIVRNITMASPLGLVQIKLTMPLDTDVEAVRDLMLAAFTNNDDVLDVPAPAVALDGLEPTGITFNATGFVASPRTVYNTRSALLFTVLTGLREAKLPIAKQPTMLLRDPSAGGPVLPPVPGLAPPAA